MTQGGSRPRAELRNRARRPWRRFLAFALTGTVLSSIFACSRTPKREAPSSESATSPASLPNPQFRVTKDTPGALFTWVDRDGSFQLADAIVDIPDYARPRVRVVIEGQSPGSAAHVYVVDVNTLAEGKEVSPSSIPRVEWENSGKTERDKKVAALRPKEELKGPTPSDLGVDAIVYGADWCQPCHLAEDYLKSKGARVVKKDIEEDPSAAGEMRQKLKSAGMGGSSIPILDVGGTILRGFSERAIDSALKHAKK
jgi:glutaredoxin